MSSEIYIELSFEALRAVSDGKEIVFYGDDGVHVVVACDEETVNRFGQAVQRALLQMLPVSDTVH